MVVWTRSMKYVATVPSSSTSYYRSRRCRLTKSSDAMDLNCSSSESTEPFISRQCCVSIEAAESSTSAKDECEEKKTYSKPTQSYVMMIATAIMESVDQRMSLGAIYKWIEKHYPYFTNNDATQGRWRNSVRHNLSLNDCFIKVGRCEDGKGNYWSIHPQNLADFQRGDFKQKQSRRRRGRRKGTDAYLSFLASNGQMVLDSNTGLPLYSPYTDEERKAYRLDEALMRRNIGGLRFVPHQSESCVSSPCGRQLTNQHAPSWQYSNYMGRSQDPTSCSYPSYNALQSSGYNSLSSNVNYSPFYHQVPASTCPGPCQCCPQNIAPQTYSQHRYALE